MDADRATRRYAGAARGSVAGSVHGDHRAERSRSVTTAPSTSKRSLVSTRRHAEPSGPICSGTLLSAALMLPLAALVFWLMRSAGSLWWLYAWLVFIGFQLLMLAIYPTFIAPIFNKFSPLALAIPVAQLRRC